MTETVGQAGQLHAPSAFYLCLDAHRCGLRFPVSHGDKFHGRCPRCGGEVQVVATVKPAAASDATSQFTAAQVKSPASRIQLLLDNWRSLFNVGAAFRTADGVGLRHIYLCGITATPDGQPKLAKTALGAERNVAWSYHADAVQLACQLKHAGLALWVLESGPASTSLFDINLGLRENSVTHDIILAAGNEKSGVDPGLLDIADHVIHLPMAGQKESLNVAVALSVAAYWLRAQEMAAASHEPVG